MLQQLSNGNWAWKISDEIRGSLSATLIKSLSNWCQISIFSREAGGLILGFTDIETEGLLAELITTPCWGDKRKRHSFYRGERHQLKADAWHSKTDGRGTLIGLWHSHPEPKPHPSGTDWTDLEKMLRCATYSGPGLVYIIVGTEYIGCWFGQRDGKVHSLGMIKI